MASLPGSTVWQNETSLPHLLAAPTVPVPSWQYGLSGNGLRMLPSLSQYRPPLVDRG
jgi:hypothetical protein